MKKPLSILLSLAVAGLLAACGNQAATDTDQASEDGVEQVTVAAGNAYFPFTYLDDQGELAGYDIEVLKAVDEKLEDYEFSYAPYEFKTLLPTLDSGQARLATHQFTRNPEREENYLFGDENYTEFNHFILTREDNDFNPTSLDDLAGHTVFVASGTNYAALIEEYNANNEEQINATFGEMSTDVIAQEVLSGSAEATLVSEIDVVNFNNQYDNAFKSSEEPVHVSETFFVFAQGDDDFKSLVDQALVELKEEGVIDSLADEFIVPAEG